MKCPKCNSENVHFGTNTSSTGCSFIDSCCGFLILGPLGLLCGACGAGTSTDEFWICGNCGHKFSNEKAKEYLKDIAQIQKDEEALYNEYLENKRIIGSEKKRKDFEQRVSTANGTYDSNKSAYFSIVEKYIKNGTPKQKKYAQALKNDDSLVFWQIAAFVLAVITFAVFVCAEKFLPILISLFALAIVITYIAGVKRNVEKAEEMLIENDNELNDAKRNMDRAYAELQSARSELERYDKMVKYENDHNIRGNTP